MDVAFEPRVLGPYVLLSALAHGGMGSVFIAATVAHEPNGARPLCLVKTLKTGLASVNDYRPRFIDESRVAVLLQHPNLCQVYGGGEANGEFYLAMELIEGLTFKRLLTAMQVKKAQLSNTEATALGIALLRGLHAAHTTRAPNGGPLGVVHRDVSPHNVMVDIQGRVKVIDFGLATSVLKETFTESAVVLGKSAYMAPEQARGEDVTPAVDQYAAAIVVYELLTDDRFYGDLPSRAIWSVVGAGSHKPRAWHDVPPEFVPILQRALSPVASDRFPSCGAFADALAALVADAVTPEATAGLGSIVRRLKPEELDAIAVARVALAAWDQPKKKKPAAPAAGVVVAAAEPTARIVHDAPAEDPETAETSSTVLTRPRGLKPRSRAPLIAAAGVAVFAAVVVGLVLLIIVRTPQPAVVVAALPVVSPPVPPPVPPLVVAPPLVAPVVVPVRPPPPKPPAVVVVDPWVKLEQRLKALAAREDCEEPGQVLGKVRTLSEGLRSPTRNPEVFRSILEKAEGLCGAP
jgi:serine/threonine-protein kinase